MLIDLDKSKLVKYIYNESKPQRKDSKYNYYSLVEGFAKYVVPQLAQINLLFDEYTPHDQIHIESLFRITDELLSTTISKLNPCEACILACAIYGHDWGMAVSEDEKLYITTGKLSIGKTLNDFALIENEKYLWKSYAALKKINTDTNGYIIDPNELSKEIWREYVRNTHAQRSKYKTIKHFNNDESVFGNVVGEICASHWSQITDIILLKKSKSVLFESVNIQALAVYIRFIDLLDFGKNRTPYSLWKFINPNNIFSLNEWKKHLALEDIIITKNVEQNIVNLIVQGSTNDHKVYASLKDMENWVRIQIKENEQCLKELGKYNLGYVRLEWEIEAKGFEPIDIRFEFDRNKMFELISGEIYNGDPYVFLRELLQNSIDATKVRESRYKEKGYTIDIDKLAIKINVSHNDNGDSTIEFIDQGTGMSLNIVRNYLSVIGKSYYRSDEFFDLGIDINPISRFGVGLISCFEVANSITIKTKTDIELNESEVALEIEIENYDQQFIVKRVLKESIPIGTTIIVNVLGDKWKNGEFKDDNKIFVTDYIKDIAGFVPYPILINEDNHSTLILSGDYFDKYKNEMAVKFINVDEIFSVPISISFEDVVIIEDLESAKHIYEQRISRISKDFEGFRITGIITYFLPKETLLLSRRIPNNDQRGKLVLVNINNKLSFQTIRFALDDNGVNLNKTKKGAQKNKFQRIYLNGILVPSNIDLKFRGEATPQSSLIFNVVNIGKGLILPTLSRNDIWNISTLNNAFETIFNDEVFKILHETNFNPIGKNLFDTSCLLSRLKLYLPNEKSIIDYLSYDKWPIPFFNLEGKIEMITQNNLPSKFEVIPKKFMRDRKDPNLSFYAKHYFSKEYLDVKFFISNEFDRIYISDFGLEHNDGSGDEWRKLASNIQYSISNKYKVNGLRIFYFNGITYYIENWKINTQKIIEINKIDKLPSSIKFYSFSNELNNTLGVFPISFNVDDTVFNLIFNTNHIVGKKLKTAFEIYYENIDIIPKALKEKLYSIYMSYPFMGRGYSIKNNFAFNGIHLDVDKWIRDFFKVELELGLIDFTEDEYVALKQKFIIVPCYD